MKFSVVCPIQNWSFPENFHGELEESEHKNIRSNSAIIDEFIRLPVRRLENVLSCIFRFSMKKYPDKTTFDERSLFSVLAVLTT